MDPLQERFRQASRVNADAFRSLDPEAVAEFLVTVVESVTTRRVTGSEDVVAAVRAEGDRYVEDCLLAD